MCKDIEYFNDPKDAIALKYFLHSLDFEIKVKMDPIYFLTLPWVWDEIDIFLFYFILQVNYKHKVRLIFHANNFRVKK